jgi:hypothetical protein
MRSLAFGFWFYSNYFRGSSNERLKNQLFGERLIAHPRFLTKTKNLRPDQLQFVKSKIQVLILKDRFEEVNKT